MMHSAGLTFTSILFTLYSLLQYFSQKADIFKYLFLLHVYWFIFHLSSIIVVICFSNTLSSEVWTTLFCILLIKNIWFFYFDLLKSKHIAWIAHDISNSCDDPNIVLSVCSSSSWLPCYNLRFPTLFLPLRGIFQLAQLSRQLEHRSPVVTCPFLAFNWKLLFSVREIVFHIVQTFNFYAYSRHYRILPYFRWAVPWPHT